MKKGRTEIFTLHLWQENLGEGRTEWRGSIQHALSGEVRYFRDWQMLGDCLAAMLPDVEAPAVRPSEQSDATATQGQK